MAKVLLVHMLASQHLTRNKVLYLVKYVEGTGLVRKHKSQCYRPLSVPCHSQVHGVWCGVGGLEQDGNTYKDGRGIAIVAELTLINLNGFGLQEKTTVLKWNNGNCHF